MPEIKSCEKCGATRNPEEAPECPICKYGKSGENVPKLPRSGGPKPQRKHCFQCENYDFIKWKGKAGYCSNCLKRVA